MKKCDDCLGSGCDPSGRGDCTLCHGTGLTVLIENRIPYIGLYGKSCNDNTSSLKMIECKDCDGKGSDFDPSDFSNKRCQSCGGSGEVEDVLPNTVRY